MRIGASVSQLLQLRSVPRGLRIASVLPDTPSERAHLQQGDLIVAVDGRSIAGVSSEVSTARIKGPEGTDVTLVAKLLMLYRALEAAEVLAREGISVEIIDPRSLVPFDEETVLESVAKTSRLVIVEEDTVSWGWGAEVVARVAERGLTYLDAPIKRVAAPDVPIPFAPALEWAVIPDAARIMQAVREVMA